MLGSHFDLSEKIAAIAAKRELETKPSEKEDAFVAFDEKVTDLIRSLRSAAAPAARERQSDLRWPRSSADLD